MLKLNRKAQSILEYTILVIIVIGVFVAMNQYIKRGIQGRWKSATDDFGDQYDPRLANGVTKYTTVANSSTTVETINGIDPDTGVDGSWTNRVDESHSVEKKTGNMTVGSEE